MKSGIVIMWFFPHKRNFLLWYLTWSCVLGQQYHHFADYGTIRENYFTSLSIVDSGYRSVSVVRHQWIDFPDAPRTYLTSLWGPIVKDKLYGGGYLFADFAGPTRRYSFMISANYKLTINEELFAGMGISLGGQNFAIDGERLSFQYEEPLAKSYVMNDLVVDGVVSASLVSKWGNLSFSAFNVFNNRLDLIKGSSNKNNLLARHFALYVEPQFQISQLNLRVFPYMVGKYVSPVPFQIDGGIRILYNDRLWAGGFYRTLDAYGFFLGYEFPGGTGLGYAMEIPHTNMKSAGGLTHEIYLIINFMATKKASPGTEATTP